MSPHTIKLWLWRISKKAKCNSSRNPKQTVSVSHTRNTQKSEQSIKSESSPYPIPLSSGSVHSAFGSPQSLCLICSFFVMSISSRKCFNLLRWKQWKDLQFGWPLLHYFTVTNSVTTSFVVTNSFLIYKKRWDKKIKKRSYYCT